MGKVGDGFDREDRFEIGMGKVGDGFDREDRFDRYDRGDEKN